MKKTVSVLLFFTIVFLSFATSVFAYNNSDNHSCLWEDPENISYKFIADTPTGYKTHLNNAVSKWEAKTDADLTITTNSANFFGTFNEDSTTMGRTVWTCKFFGLSNKISSSDAGLNETYFDNSTLSSTNKEKLKLKVSLHEVGHFIGLGHSTATEAVMKQGIYYYSDLFQDDIDGYNDLY